MSQPCLGPVLSCIVAFGRSCRRPGRQCHSLYHDTSSTKVMRTRRVARCRACRSAPVQCRRALGAVSQSWLHCIATQGRPPLSHDTIVVSRPSSHPRALHAVSHARSAVSWPYHVVSWTWPGRIVATPAARPSAPQSAPALPPSLACHNTAWYIVTQT